LTPAWILKALNLPAMSRDEAAAFSRELSHNLAGRRTSTNGHARPAALSR